jgi:hypothetical protein
MENQVVGDFILQPLKDCLCRTAGGPRILFPPDCREDRIGRRWARCGYG